MLPSNHAVALFRNAPEQGLRLPSRSSTRSRPGALPGPKITNPGPRHRSGLLPKPVHSPKQSRSNIPLSTGGTPLCRDSGSQTLHRDFLQIKQASTAFPYKATIACIPFHPPVHSSLNPPNRPYISYSPHPSQSTEISYFESFSWALGISHGLGKLQRLCLIIVVSRPRSALAHRPGYISELLFLQPGPAVLAGRRLCRSDPGLLRPP